ncbi:MAG: hypothetical protein VW462_11600, partial [Rhodospirillales bacterium]
GRIGNGWYPVAANPKYPLDTPELYAEGLGQVRKAAEDAGRAPSLTGALLAIYSRIGAEQEGRDGARKPFTGSAQAIIDDIEAYRSKGMSHFLIGGDGDDLSKTLERLEEFSQDVMAKVDS